MTTQARAAILVLIGLGATASTIGRQAPAVKEPHGAVVRSEKQAFRMEAVVRGLETPWAIAFLPDRRMLVTERPGRLRIVDQGRLLPPVTGIPAVWTVQDGGLFDVEVHPHYRRNGWIYLSYSEPGPSNTSMTVIERGRLRGNAWTDRETIYRAPAGLYTPQNIHYGSRFLFDRSGHLFYSIGDKGNTAAAQDLSTPLGKIHRVNDDGSLPADNPFAKQAGALGSIWSYGHRNPQGMAVDPATGSIWATEHGPRGGDELNRIERGGNYGWAVVSHGREDGITATDGPGMIPPAAHWTPGVAPSGLAFYAGRRYPGWENSLFVACLAGQQLRRIELRGGAVTHQEVVFGEYGRVRDIVVGPDDLFYLAVSVPGARVSDTTQGMIVRLDPIAK